MARRLSRPSNVDVRYLRAKVREITFEELCGILREELGSAPVSSPDHPHVGDGDPVLGTLVLVNERLTGFAVGTQERGQWAELARFDSESDACAYALDSIRKMPPTGCASRRSGKSRIRTDHPRNG
jgi:hypothetical protein